MRFIPRFSITNAIAAALTEIERARGFLDAASLSDEWIYSMRSRAFLLEAHHTTHIEGTRLTIEEAADLLAGDDVPGADPDDTRELLNYRDAFKFARDWWHDDPVCLLPGEEGGHTVFVIEFYDGCKYFGYTRKSVVARVASLMSESGGWGSNAFVREHGGSVPCVVRCVASNMDQRQGRQLRDLLVARAPGDVYVAYGDPVQWVIGRNLHRRHLTGLQRASCVSAALEWEKQGKQRPMGVEPSETGQDASKQANWPVWMMGLSSPNLRERRWPTQAKGLRNGLTATRMLAWGLRYEMALSLARKRSGRCGIRTPLDRRPNSIN